MYLGVTLYHDKVTNHSGHPENDYWLHDKTKEKVLELTAKKHRAKKHRASALTKQIRKKNENLSFENFNDFIDTLQSVRWVALNNDVYQLSTCTCRFWTKNFICNHVISMSKTAELFQSFPALDIPIESNAKRGPKSKKDKAGLALTRCEYIHQTQELFPNLQIASASTFSAATASATAATASTTAATALKRRGRPPKENVDPSEGEIVSDLRRSKRSKK
jgi:hypothetical protein